VEVKGEELEGKHEHNRRLRLRPQLLLPLLARTEDSAALHVLVKSFALHAGLGGRLVEGREEGC
jgi:hypothetical protein